MSQTTSASASLSIAPSKLEEWVQNLLVCMGCQTLEAQQGAHHLVLANLSGHDSHGVGMVPRYVDSFLAGELKLNQQIRIASDHGAMLSVDGQQGLGQSITHQAMELAIARARQHGLCVMGLHNSHHLGRVGHWAEQAIAAGFVSIHFTNVNSAAAVAPFGGAQGRMVTNPFTIGVPRPGAEPLLLDFATSTIAHGKARVAHNKGVPVQAGALIDAQGNPTTDPGVLFSTPMGALTAFGGHKGYALAVMCEILGGALSGGHTLRPQTIPASPAVWNHMLTIVLDPAKLGSLERFEQEIALFEQWNASAPLAPGVDKIRLPGEPERDYRRQRASAIEIDAGTLAQMDEAVSKLRARGLANANLIFLRELSLAG